MADLEGTVEEGIQSQESSQDGTLDPALTTTDATQDGGQEGSETLEEKYAAAVRGITEKGTELGATKRELDAIRAQFTQLQTALQNPDFVETLAGHLKKMGNSPVADTKTLAEEAGLGEDLGGAIEKYLSRAGYLRADDPRVSRVVDGFAELSNRTVGQDYDKIVTEYGVTDQSLKTKVFQKLERSNGALTLEQAFHAETLGKYAAEKERKAQGQKIVKKQDAQVPRSTVTRDVKPAQARTLEKKEDDWRGAFRAAAKEHNIDLGNLLGPKKW